MCPGKYCVHSYVSGLAGRLPSHSGYNTMYKVAEDIIRICVPEMLTEPRHFHFTITSVFLISKIWYFNPKFPFQLHISQCDLVPLNKESHASHLETLQKTLALYAQKNVRQ